MKLLNTAPNMDNLLVITYTAGLGCHHKDFFICGNQDAAENQGVTLNMKYLHFTSRFSSLELAD